MNNLKQSDFESDRKETWISASHKIVHSNHHHGVLEVQGIGEVHLKLREFETVWIPEPGQPKPIEISQLDLQSTFYFEMARQWTMAVFSLAYKIERGEVFQKRDVNEFKKALNPLRCAFEKGYVDCNKNIGCFPKAMVTQAPFKCITWQVPNRELETLEYSRVEIAEALLYLCFDTDDDSLV
ncbi:hypothetical protein [uncultured Ruegeria sp.]|uniref:hypothetical protein n=1 Tax=uncultured Ruegeria sp. TaxID=259304 RepID=UPI0026353B9B|nr:hypothetical protein [uncultured Ruegeria sp.]